MAAVAGVTESELARQTIAQARSRARLGDAEGAIVLFDEALAMLEGDEPTPLAADALRGKGGVLRERGDADAARRCILRSLEVAERAAYDAGRAHALNWLGVIAQRSGDLDRAERLYRDAAEAAAACGETRLLGLVEQNLGVVAATRADYDGALVRYRLSYDAFSKTGDGECMACVLNNLGMLYMQYGKHADALATFEQALTLAHRADHVVYQVTIELNLAEVRIALEDLHEATLSVARALAAATASRDYARLADGLRLQAAIDRRRGRFADAIESLKRARYYARESQDALLGMEILRELGAVYRECGDLELTREAWQEAAAGFADIGATREAAAVGRQLAALAP